MSNNVTTLNPHLSLDLKKALDDIYETLGGKRTANGYDVHCPCHEDGEPSLSISIGKDKILYHCKAGCKQESIGSWLKANNLLPAVSTQPKKVVAIYDYGAFQKIRLEPKDFRIRHRSGNQWIYSLPKGIQAPLYNIDKLNSMPDATAVICEGEKDCDNFNALNAPGYVAVTNFEGAGKWKDYYSDALANRNVIIFEDNDEPGRQRTKDLTHRLNQSKSVQVVRFDTLPEKADFSLWLQLQGQMNSNLPVFELLKTGKKVQTLHPSEKTPTAKREDYYQLITDVLGDIGRDIFSGNLMYRDSEGWQKGKIGLPRIRAEAQTRATSGICRYNRNSIADYLSEMESQMPVKTLFSVPEWDGEDRIAKIARAVTLDGSQSSFTSSTLYNYLCYWSANVWKKIYDPTCRGVILILNGPQNIGKDWLLDALAGGFDYWYRDLSISQRDKDNFLQLSEAAVLRISEFDRVAKLDQATLKAMVTTPYTDIRSAYAEESRRRLCRASFVASVNSDDIYRDPSGHTRYAVFNIRSITFNYPRSAEDQKQIIAQGKHLYESGFQLPEIDQKDMDIFIHGKAPQSDAEFICDHWNTVMRDYLRNLVGKDDIKKRGWITNTEITSAGLFDKMTKSTGYRLKTIQSILKNSGYGKIDRVDGEVSRGYAFVTSEQHIEDSKILELF